MTNVWDQKNYDLQIIVEAFLLLCCEIILIFTCASTITGFAIVSSLLLKVCKDYLKDDTYLSLPEG